MPRAHAIASALALECLGLSGCGLLDVGQANEITGIEPVSLRVTVIELGPLNPERVAYPSSAPVSEVLPGDRVRLEIEVVDTDGLALPDEQLDSIWLLYNSNIGYPPEVPLDDPALELRCDELEPWTIDASCRLGEGRGSIEFQVPALGERVDRYEALWVYAIVAWNGQRAEECWTARREGGALPSDCDFMRFSVRIGPPWWLLAYAAAEDVPTTMSVELFHPAVYLQQANRAPVLEHIVVELDGPAMELTGNDGIVGPIAVVPGQLVSLTPAVDEGLQFSQSAFSPLDLEGGLFVLLPERVGTRVATAGPVRVVSHEFFPLSVPTVIAVDDDAEPGIARAILVLFDDRGGETVVRVELDIQ